MVKSLNNIASAFLEWPHDKDQILARITESRNILKIFLKTKDDNYFLRDWIEHHEKIVGKENLFIFDNMSTNPSVIGTLEELSQTYNIFRFHGFHNDIHDSRKYDELYRAICDSAEFFTFLDTDERLIFVEGDRCATGPEILKFLTENHDTPVFPGIWVSNARSSSSIFSLGNHLSALEFGITNGKPVINTKSGFHGFLNHNIDVAQLITNRRVQRNFVVLHLNRLYPEQRIASNLNKLIARKFISETDTAETTLQKDLSTVTDSNIVSYVSEISELYSGLKSQSESYKFTRGDIELSQNGSIKFHSASEQNLLDLYLGKDIILSIDKAHRSIKIKVSKIDENSKEFRGYVDVISEDEISGWAVDKDGQPCWINISINNSYVLKAHSHRSRKDLAELDITAGLGGFKIKIKSLLEESTNYISATFPDGSGIANGQATIKISNS